MAANLPDVATAAAANAALKSVMNVLAASGVTAAAKTANTLAYFGADQLLASYAITSTQLAYLATISEDIQVALDDSMSITQDQTISGDNEFTGDNTFTTSIITEKNVGTKAAVATVAVEEIGDGMHHVTTLTLTAYIVGPLASAAAAKILVPPQALYVFPAGVHVLEVTYATLGLTAAGTAVTPDVGLGSVIGDGTANPTLNLGAAGTEDIMTGYAIADTLTHAAVAAGPVGATAGILTGISLNKAADSKNLFLNCAATWNANNTGNLTATGTIVIKWTTLA